MHDELMVRVDSKARKLGLQKVQSCSGSSKYEEVGNGTGPPIILDKGRGVLSGASFSFFRRQTPATLARLDGQKKPRARIDCRYLFPWLLGGSAQRLSGLGVALFGFGASDAFVKLEGHLSWGSTLKPIHLKHRKREHPRHCTCYKTPQICQLHYSHNLLPTDDVAQPTIPAS
jgi:hypothetical protein